jgi:hypothetical protein
MSVFILYNRDEDFLLGCYSSLEEAKKAYQNALNKARRIPTCDVKKIKLDVTAEDFNSGNEEVEATWIIKPRGEWIESK